MKLGYFARNGNPMHTHIMVGNSMSIMCGRYAMADADLTTWHGGILGEVDCGLCLRCQRAKLRKEIRKVERRMAGQDSVQQDALL